MLAIWSLVPLPFLNPAWTSGSSHFHQHCFMPSLTHATAKDSWTLMGKSDQSLLGSLLFSPGSWYAQVSVCACQEFVFQSYVSSGGSLVGLKATSSKRAYAIPRSAAPRDPVPAAVHCWPITPEETLWYSSVSVSVGPLGLGVHKLCLSPLSVYDGYGIWLEMRIHPFDVLHRAYINNKEKN